MENGESDTHFQRDEPCASCHIRIANQKKLQVGARKRNKRAFFCTVYFVRRNFFNICFITVYIVLHYAFKIQIFLLKKKHYFIHFCSLFLKSSKVLSLSLNSVSLKSVSFRIQRQLQHTACAKLCLRVHHSGQMAALFNYEQVLHVSICT